MSWMSQTSASVHPSELSSTWKASHPSNPSLPIDGNFTTTLNEKNNHKQPILASALSLPHGEILPTATPGGRRISSSLSDALFSPLMSEQELTSAVQRNLKIRDRIYPFQGYI